MSYRDKRTEEEKREDMLRRRTGQQAAGLVLVNELHDAGFSGIWIDSTQIGGDGHYYCHVVIENSEIDHESMAAILAVAEVHDAHMSLKEVWLNQQHFSRIVLWPHVVGEDD